MSRKKFLYQAQLVSSMGISTDVCVTSNPCGSGETCVPYGIHYQCCDFGSHNPASGGYDECEGKWEKIFTVFMF